MKKSLVVILSFLLLADVFSATKKVGLVVKLNGKVKEMVITIYNIKTKLGDEVREIAVKTITKYDANGNQVEGTCYNADGSLKWTNNFRYDDRNNQIEMII